MLSPKAAVTSVVLITTSSPTCRRRILWRCSTRQGSTAKEIIQIESTAMNPKLTGQERVNRAFARCDHDHVPRHESFWGETIERWQKEGLNGDYRAVLDLLESD